MIATGRPIQDQSQFNYDQPPEPLLQPSQQPQAPLISLSLPSAQIPPRHTTQAAPDIHHICDLIRTDRGYAAEVLNVLLREPDILINRPEVLVEIINQLARQPLPSGLIYSLVVLSHPIFKKHPEVLEAAQALLDVNVADMSPQQERILVGILVRGTRARYNPESAEDRIANLLLSAATIAVDAIPSPDVYYRVVYNLARATYLDQVRGIVPVMPNRWLRELVTIARVDTAVFLAEIVDGTHCQTERPSQLSQTRCLDSRQMMRIVAVGNIVQFSLKQILAAVLKVPVVMNPVEGLIYGLTAHLLMNSEHPPHTTPIKGDPLRIRCEALAYLAHIAGPQANTNERWPALPYTPAGVATGLLQRLAKRGPKVPGPEGKSLTPLAGALLKDPALAHRALLLSWGQEKSEENEGLNGDLGG
jgi:hypothetical protein